MKKVFIGVIITFILSFNQAYSQDYIDFMGKITKYDVSSLYIETKSPEKHDHITIDDFKPIGFFGSNYQRFYIHFISVVKNQNDPLEYFVYGKTKLKDNICAFQGTMRIIDCKTLKEGDIPEYIQGNYTVKYEFFEDPLSGGSGEFVGEAVSFFFIDDDDNIYYDGISLGADGFKNHQFTGNWIDYTSGKSFSCNWGDFRIPECGDLDVGTGEFGANEKYFDQGWKSFNVAKGYNKKYTDEEVLQAKAVESKEWWK